MSTNAAAQKTLKTPKTANGRNVQKIFKLGLILFIVTAITGLILGVVYEITASPIKQTQERLKNEALSGALPEAENFSLLELAPGAPDIVKEVQGGTKDGVGTGYCITVSPKGYGGPIEIVVGIASDGALRAIRILNQTETPGLGAKAADAAFTNQYSEKQVERMAVVKTTPSTPDQIQAISGATITSEAVTLGVNTALEYWQTNLRGGK